MLRVEDTKVTASTTTAAFSVVIRNAIRNAIRNNVKEIVENNIKARSNDAVRITSTEARDISGILLETPPKD